MTPRGSSTDRRSSLFCEGAGETRVSGVATSEIRVTPVTASVREGVMTERLRDSVTFTREGRDGIEAASAVVVVSAR